MSSLDKALGWIYRICGLSPSGSRADSYFTILAMLLLISMTLERMHSIDVDLDNRYDMFVTAIQYLSFVGAAGHIFRNWVKSDSYMNIMRDLERYEPSNTNDKDTQKHIWIIILVIFLTLVPAMYWSGIWACMTVLLGFAAFNSPILQNIDLVGKIRLRFSALNNRLISLAAESDTPTISTELDSVFRSHSTLQALVVDVDLHFCFYNLLSYTSRFLFCVTVMYMYLNSIETPKLKLVSGFVMGFFRQLLFIISQAFVSHACSQEANRTVLLAHRVLKPDSPVELWEKVELFSSLSTDTKVHFTVGGIFTLDRALITQTLLTALSYLIIAVQLREVKLFGDNVPDITTSSVVLATNSSNVLFPKYD